MTNQSSDTELTKGLVRATITAFLLECKNGDDFELLTAFWLGDKDELFIICTVRLSEVLSIHQMNELKRRLGVRRLNHYGRGTHVPGAEELPD